MQFKHACQQHGGGVVAKIVGQVSHADAWVFPALACPKGHGRGVTVLHQLTGAVEVFGGFVAEAQKFKRQDAALAGAQGQAQFLLPLCVVGPVGHEAACVGQTPEHVGGLFGGMTGLSQPALCMFGRLCVATGSVQQTGQIVQGVRVLRFLGQGLLKIGHGGLITAHAREHRTQGVQDVGVVGAQLPRLLKHRQRLLAVEMAIGVQLDAQRKERLGLNAFGHGRLKGWAHAGMDCPVMMRWWRGRQTLW